MRILLDTSVLVAALVEAHPRHVRALPWLQETKAGKHKLYVSTHSLSELYAVLTTLPLKPKISPLIAWRLIRENVEVSATLISLSATDYKNTVKEMAELGMRGGVIYDALIVKAARKEKVGCILTFNEKDFLRVWPEGESLINTP